MKHEIDLPDLPEGFEYEKTCNVIKQRLPKAGDWILNSLTGKPYKINSGSFKSIEFILRKTEPETLEDRIKAKYSDYEVVMLEWKEAICGSQILHLYDRPHIDAQSIRGFYRYVYEVNKPSLDDRDLFTVRRPTYSESKNPTKHPVAVLFEK